MSDGNIKWKNYGESSLTLLAVHCNEEIAKLDLRIAGKLIKESAFHLSHKVNHELMEPISSWLKDKDWMTRFTVYEHSLPNWAEYKRNQREWTEQQKEILRNRMKMYWQEIHKQRNQKSEVAKLLSESRLSDAEPLHELSVDNEKNSNSETNQYNYASPILLHYSLQAERRRNTLQEFTQALQTSPSNLLPWRVILLTEIHESISNADKMRLTDFKTYYQENKKTDIASKLIHLLQLEKENKIHLSQSEPFGAVNISLENYTDSTPLFSNQHPEGPDTYQSKISQSNSNINSEIQIKDKSGKTYPEIDWRNLSNAQRNKVVADIKNNEIICKSM